MERLEKLQELGQKLLPRDSAEPHHSDVIALVVEEFDVLNSKLSALDMKIENLRIALGHTE